MLTNTTTGSSIKTIEVIHMKPYYVEGADGWFVAIAKNKQVAKTQGVFEFGQGNVRTVRLATNNETKKYLFEKGIKELETI